MGLVLVYDNLCHRPRLAGGIVVDLHRNAGMNHRSFDRFPCPVDKLHSFTECITDRVGYPYLAHDDCLSGLKCGHCPIGRRRGRGRLSAGSISGRRCRGAAGLREGEGSDRRASQD